MEETMSIGLWIDEHMELIAVVCAVVILVILVILGFDPSFGYSNSHMEAVNECIAYNANHTNSSCWV